MAGPWISIISLGALMGLLGQAVRVVVGLKKAKEHATALQQTFGEMFEPSALLISLGIGAVAGALAAVIVVKPDSSITTETLLGLAAAGYSGADFVEGFVSRYLPPGVAQPAAPQPAGAPPPPGAPVLSPAPRPASTGG